MCYLFTVTLVGPMDHDWAQIYAYVTALWKPGAKNVLEAPDELDPGQQEKLDQLKRQIWESQQSRKETAMPENVKVVLDVHKDGVRVGIGAEGCDPIITPITGELAGALDEVPQLVADAQARWGEAPRNPKYTKPKAPRGKAKAKADAAAAPEQPKPQPSAEPPADAATTEAVPATPDNTGGASAEALPLLGEDPPGVPEAELAVAEQEATADAAKVTETIAAPTVAGVNPPLTCHFDECGFEAFSQEAVDDHISHAHGPTDQPEVGRGGVTEETAVNGPPEAPEAPETPAEPVQAAQAAPKSGAWVYIVKGVSHSTVHDALRALGETQEEIDKHQYWHRHDRLPKRLADAIEKRGA
jgi:hypothetical protein